MLYDHWENVQLVFEVCHHIAAIILFIVKLFNEFCNYDKVCVRRTSLTYLCPFNYYFNEIICYGQARYLYEAMENHWNIFTSEFEMRILREYSILSRKILQYFIRVSTCKKYVDKLVHYTY